MTAPAGPPPEAITAAGNALRERWLREFPAAILQFGCDPMDWAQTALEAAAPHLAAAEPGYEPFVAAGPAETEIRVVPESAVAEAVAAEREQCAQLADQVGATYHKTPGGPRMPSVITPFGTLLRAQP